MATRQLSYPGLSSVGSLNYNYDVTCYTWNSAADLMTSSLHERLTTSQFQLKMSHCIQSWKQFQVPYLAVIAASESADISNSLLLWSLKAFRQEK
jgi:hypothetical protein